MKDIVETTKVVCQFGGVATVHLDFDLAPFVKISFSKRLVEGLRYISELSDDEIKKLKEEYEFIIDQPELSSKYPKAMKYAKDMLNQEGSQAAQGLYHNLNTLESRAGSQVPFTSINFGRDTSTEGRLVTKWMLDASIEGIGKLHRTSIFPISIFQYKKGINSSINDPNYDLKKLAIESMSKRIYPNWLNCDFSEANEDPDDIDSMFASMG